MSTRLRLMPHAVGCSLLILFLAATSAPADTIPRTYGFKAGHWIPGEELFRDVLGSGLLIGGSYSLSLRPDRWIDFELLYWKGEGDFSPAQNEIRSSSVTLVPLALSLRADLQAIRGVQPFALGGIDLNIVKEEVEIVQTDIDQGGTNSLSNAFLGLHFGAGAQYEISPKALLYLEARLSISSADMAGVGGVVGNGTSLGGVGILAGVRTR